MNKLENLIEKEKLAIISCYDATFASMLANTEIDALLVGDSLGTRVKGESDILNVTMHEILYHTRAVKNGANSLPIISDMPIHSYDTKSAALINAKKIIEAGADGVKLEGGKEIEDIVIYNESSETGIVSFNIEGVHPHDAITYFDGDNICMRAGHHCAQLVIKWLEVVATLRVSFYIYNTVEDCDKFVDSLKKARDFFKEMGF